jgi:TonB family protein
MTILIWAATRPLKIDATTDPASLRTKLIYTVTPGSKRSGGGDPSGAAPRSSRGPAARPANVNAPMTMVPVEPLPAAPVPAIPTEEFKRLPGLPVPVGDGTTPGKGAGPGGGGGHGPGNGPGDGPDSGDVYDAGVGGVSAPFPLHEVKPNYTVDAMRAKITGTVVLDIVVLADGSVDPARIRITRTLEPGLDQQAAIAVRQWRFRPSLRFGQPVASRVIVELFFMLR